MKKIVLSTRNRHKKEEFEKLLSEYLPDIKLLSLDDIGFNGEIEENSDSFEGNAAIKAKAASEFSGLPAIADDSGLETDALNGAPGIYSARFSGSGDDEKNIQKLLKLLENVPDSERGGRFVCAICLSLPSGEIYTVRGECEGYITREKRGGGNFGYDPVFYYPPLNKTYAELEPAVKNAISHRGEAVKKLIKLLETKL